MASRSTYRIDLAYDGSKFAGYQRQPGSVRSVEGVLVEALQRFVPRLEQVAVGGRTDKGVHARGQVVSFFSWSALDLDDVARRIEAVGEGDLVVMAARRVPHAFHASFSATSRTYVYRARVADLDVARLDAMLVRLVGRRCFFAFARKTPVGQASIRWLKRARAWADGEERVRVEVVADGFLRKQVRVLIATGIAEMRKGADPNALLRLSELGDRTLTAPPAPADGLCLASVGYS